MSNCISIEFGIIIEGCNYNDLLAICDVPNEFAYFKFEEVGDLVTDVPGHLAVENDEPDATRHYIQFGDVEFPLTRMPKKPKDYAYFKGRVENQIKNAKVSWGIFEKWR